jgi:hypothetical protein
MSRLHWLILAVLLPAGVALLTIVPARGQQILQFGFETRDPVWKAERADAAYKVLTHEVTEETRHGGLRSEHIRARAEKGSYVHFVYKIGRAPVTEDLNASLWLKSDRPGVQLYCRVVLPRERDPSNIDQPRTLLLRCEPYQSTRWKLLSLQQPIKRLQEQQQLLQAQLGREVITTDAYVSEFVLNVYDAPGVVDVWIDDLEVGPILDTAPATVPAPAPQRTPIASTTPVLTPRVDTVQLNGARLTVSGQRFFLRGIRHTGTPLRVLREAGFNTVWLDESTPQGLVDDAINLGFWLVPTINPPRVVGPDGRVEGHLTSGDAFAQQVSRFLQQDAVLSWDLGGNLTAENYAETARAARAFRTADPMRPVCVDVWDGYRTWSRGLDQVMLGSHRFPLGTSLELDHYRQWLMQRRRLAAPGTFCWTWVQNHVSDWFLQQMQRDGLDKAPLGPLPEQVRLMTYLAVASGYRGVAFWSDRFLADSEQARDRLFELALLNQELKMLEPILVDADGNKEPEWIPTSRGEVSASVIRTPRGILVLPVWGGGGAQYVPGQAAVPNLGFVVPLVPDTAQAWEISPGGVKAHPVKRVLGGVEVYLKNFSLTSALLFTSDLGPTGIIVQLQDQQRRMEKMAAQWTQHQAQEELAKVEQVQAELERVGHVVSDAGALLQKARESLAACVQHRRNGDHAEAYQDAQVALRALRLLMRAQWEQAVRNLDSPVSSPYAVSYFTLPRHWELLDELRQMQPGANVLPDGDFEAPPDKIPEGWTVQEVPPLDPVVGTARRVTDVPLQGKQCLHLSVMPRSPVPVETLERTFLAIHSPEVELKPGTLVRISAWVRTPGITGSEDGALFYDSAGGEPLAVRIRHTRGWRRYSLFRRVPESGRISVTLAMSGMGNVFFDDVRIEPLVRAASTAGRPRQAGGQSGSAQQTPRTPPASQQASGDQRWQTPRR